MSRIGFPSSGNLSEIKKIFGRSVRGVDLSADDDLRIIGFAFEDFPEIFISGRGPNETEAIERVYEFLRDIKDNSSDTPRRVTPLQNAFVDGQIRAVPSPYHSAGANG